MSYPPPPPYSEYNATNAKVQYQTGQSAYVPQPAVVIQPVGMYLGRHPQPMQCPACRQQVVTAVRYEPGGMTWLIALLICFFGGIFGCCIIPFFVADCQDATHICPSCHATLGRRSPF